MLIDTLNLMPINTIKTLKYLIKEAGVDIYVINNIGNILAY
jgi:hypothetical protein